MPNNLAAVKNYGAIHPLTAGLTVISIPKIKNKAKLKATKTCII